ncbi:hypothetical protein [Bifidobacterium felsineum]|uniref:Membrane associated protein n=1 Tax=Bifidobacterium felsineum TaxID=2045440 RepID=A0A2M9HK02_9BIFI|nr:hypothetical protein [Bifidobacterium felsineum]MBT1164999.1 hypothetical protein [Bifidobacterium felsineum]PJM77117.1 hypothetical protein CSQ86_04225 [Bifidobacterium felsineum]
MTDLNNTNAADEPTTPTPDDNGKTNDLDAAWAAFEAEHKEDLNDVASSRQAKKFEKQAKKREKEALLSVDDLDAAAFTDGVRPFHERTKKSHGPRDFTGSSWLDTDDVMDRYDDGGFTPPNPDLGPIHASTVLLTALLIIGLVGTLAMILVPALYSIPVLSSILNIAFGTCTVLGLGGLVVKILNRKNHPGDKGGYYDDGARV